MHYRFDTAPRHILLCLLLGRMLTTYVPFFWTSVAMSHLLRREIVRGYLDFINKYYSIPTPPQKRVADREETYLAAGEHPTDGEEFVCETDRPALSLQSGTSSHLPAAHAEMQRV